MAAPPARLLAAVCGGGVPLRAGCEPHRQRLGLRRSDSASIVRLDCFAVALSEGGGVIGGFFITFLWSL